MNGVSFCFSHKSARSDHTEKILNPFSLSVATKLANSQVEVFVFSYAHKPRNGEIIPICVFVLLYSSDLSSCCLIFVCFSLTVSSHSLSGPLILTLECNILCPFSKLPLYFFSLLEAFYRCTALLFSEYIQVYYLSL